MIYTLTLNPALDYVVWMEQYTPGTVNRTTREQIQFGGKGINVSVMLNRLGCDTTALALAGGFTGKALEEELRKQGIWTDFVYAGEGLTRINVKIKGAEETDINGRGPVMGPEEEAQLFERLLELQAGDWLVLAGSVPRGTEQDIYERICSRLEGLGVQLVVDAEGELLLRTLPCRPFLVKPNHLELSAMVGRELRTEEELLEGGRQLQSRGARNVLISRAEQGALLLTEEGAVYRIGASKGTVKNSVGAGDSMVAGFLAGYCGTGSVQEALLLAGAAGSATAFSEGLAERELVLRLRKEMK